MNEIEEAIKKRIIWLQTEKNDAINNFKNNGFIEEAIIEKHMRVSMEIEFLEELLKINDNQNSK